jgi:hypothetical protein
MGFQQSQEILEIKPLLAYLQREGEIAALPHLDFLQQLLLPGYCYDRPSA